MKFVILVVLLSFYILSAQDIVIEEQADPLNITNSASEESLETDIDFPDSLKSILPVDSLGQTISDSILFSEKAFPDSLLADEDTLVDSLLADEDTLVDSLLADEDTLVDSLDIVEIYENLQKHLIEKKKMQEDFKLPMIVEKENFHYKTPFEPNLYFSKNGFTYLPFLVSNIHVIQNFALLNNAVYDQGFIDFSLSDYSLPVAATEAFLGLGDINMNHAVVSYKKGNILGIHDLNIEFGYAGMDGKWLGKREKSRFYNGQLFYNSNFGKFHFYYSSIDQEISSNKLANPPELFVLKTLHEKNSEMAFRWENPYLDIGYRTETAEVDTLVRELSAILLAKDLQYKSHHIHLSYEYFSNTSDDENFDVVNLDQNSTISFFELGNRLFYRNSENYFGSSDLIVNLFSQFKPQAYLEKQSKDVYTHLWHNERIAGGFLLDLSNFDINVLAGNDKIRNENMNFIEAKSNYDHKIGLMNIVLQNWTLFRSTENIYLPDLQTQTSLEFQLDLDHGNFIKLGLSNIYLSEYGYIHDMIDSITFERFSHLDAWLSIQITKQFQIKLDAVNLTNAYTLFGYPTSENLDSRHFNFNVQWIFIN